MYRRESYAERQTRAAEHAAGAARAIANRPVPYHDEPKYVEGRLDYFEGVDYETYADSEHQLWRLGYLEAQADYPNFHRDTQ